MKKEITKKRLHKIACRHAHLTDLLTRVFNFSILYSIHNSSMS